MLRYVQQLDRVMANQLSCHWAQSFVGPQTVWSTIIAAVSAVSHLAAMLAIQTVVVRTNLSQRTDKAGAYCP